MELNSVGKAVIVMEITINGSPKEIADLVYLLQCQRQVKRKPYSYEQELIPVISNCKDSDYSENQKGK